METTAGNSFSLDKNFLRGKNFIRSENFWRTRKWEIILCANTFEVCKIIRYFAIKFFAHFDAAHLNQIIL